MLLARNVPVRRKITGLGKLLSRNSLALSFFEYNINTVLANLRATRLDEALASPPSERGVNIPPRRPPEPVADDPRYWPVMRALLSEMRDLCSGAGVELRFVYVPSRNEVAADLSSQTAELTGEACAALDVPFLDLTPALRSAWRSHPNAGGSATPVYFQEDSHWTELGHDIAARELAALWAWPE